MKMQENVGLILSTASLVWFYRFPKVKYKVYIYKE